jgi:zinc and cadmium transporter
MTITITAFCLAIVIVSVLGGILPLSTVLNHTRLQVYLSFSAGAMLGAAFFHMMPEAVRMGSATTVSWSAVGLLMLFFLERFFSFHHHESHEHHHASSKPTEADPEPATLLTATFGTRDPNGRPGPRAASGLRALPWGPAAFGLAVHSLVGGFALASAVAADYQVGKGMSGAGLGVFMATFVHKPADALTITTLMLRGGASRSLAHVVNLTFALMIPVGVGLFAVGRQGVGPVSPELWTADALAFSAGTFLCIALSDLLPELQFHSHDRLKLSIALLAGLLLMAGTAWLEPL